MSSPPLAADVSASQGVTGSVDAALDRYLASVLGTLAAATRYASEHGRSAGTTSGLDERSRLEDVIDHLVAGGGKLIRPRVAFLGYLAGSAAAAPDGPEALGVETAAGHEGLIRLGTALELLHVFGLLQDDVMDEADMRRGRPTAHRSLADVVGVFEASGQPSPVARRFGESLAVLSGDLAFALAGRELRGLPAPVLDAWDDTVLELVQGQRLDMVYATEGRYDRDDTAWVAMAKSGAYTVARPLLLGALLAAPDREPPGWLTGFGRHIGMAFALADDILGVWGDPQITGKPVGDDLRQAKPTTVLGIADDVLGGQVTDAIARAGGVLSEAAVTELMARFDRHGVRAAAERALEDELAAAESELSHVPFAGVRRELTALARDLVRRRS